VAMTAARSAPRSGEQPGFPTQRKATQGALGRIVGQADPASPMKRANQSHRLSM
jgi:hypothetical protein